MHVWAGAEFPGLSIPSSQFCREPQTALKRKRKGTKEGGYNGEKEEGEEKSLRRERKKEGKEEGVFP